MFLLSVCSVAIVSAVSDHTLTVLLSTLFGFILSHDIFSTFGLLIWSLLSVCTSLPRRLKPLCDRLPDRIFLSLTGIDFRKTNSIKVHLVYFVLTIFKGVILLSVSLVILYFTFTAADIASKDLALTVLGGFVLGSFVLVGVSDALQRVYLLRVFRNPLFPWTCDNVAKFKSRRKLLRYFSIPRTLTTNYGKHLCSKVHVTSNVDSELFL